MITILILTCIILGALGRRLQGGWIEGYRWIAFILYAISCELIAFPNEILATIIFGLSVAWFTIQTNNGNTHWCGLVRSLYKWTETFSDKIPAIPFLGIKEKAYTSLCELILGGIWFGILAIFCSIVRSYVQ